MAGRLEMIALEQVEDRRPALALDILVSADDRSLVELDVDDPRVRHGLLAGAAWSCQRIHGERSARYRFAPRSVPGKMRSAPGKAT